MIEITIQPVISAVIKASVISVVQKPGMCIIRSTVGIMQDAAQNKIISPITILILIFPNLNANGILENSSLYNISNTSSLL